MFRYIKLKKNSEALPPKNLEYFLPYVNIQYLRFSSSKILVDCTFETADNSIVRYHWILVGAAYPGEEYWKPYKTLEDSFTKKVYKKVLLV